MFCTFEFFFFLKQSIVNNLLLLFPLDGMKRSTQLWAWKLYSGISAYLFEIKLKIEPVVFETEKLTENCIIDRLTY